MGFESPSYAESTEDFRSKLVERAHNLLRIEAQKTNYNRLFKALTLAALTTVAACSKEIEDQELEQNTPIQLSEIQNKESVIIEAKRITALKRIQEERIERANTEQKVFEHASQMGIEINPDSYTYRQEGLVVTEIDGIRVPEELHSPEERQRIEQARQMRGEVESKNDSHNWTEESPDIGDPNDF